uniref:Peptidase C39 domain-containing protein n=1 Tax=candidate division WWE3 bacterium TaxID=2053526 RepID=A0A7C4XIA9_UNCKA
MRKLIVFLIILALGSALIIKADIASYFQHEGSNKEVRKAQPTQKESSFKPTQDIEEGEVEENTVPKSKTLINDYHIFQSFNNCGPAAFSMALSYYGINESQQKLGQELRPYQNPQGDNDDKSVTLQELADKSKDYGLTPFRRPNGNMELIKHFIALDIPVITRTWLKVDDDIGHYRVIKGYNDMEKTLIQDDSLQGKNLTYSYDELNELWKKFNYEYLILVPREKVNKITKLLGEDNEKKAWEKAIQNTLAELEKSPDNIDARFNLSVAYYNVGNYQKSVEEFEKVEDKLSMRTLWYQVEPILAYYELKNYERVLSISERILNNNNRAFTELYILRGDIFKEQGKQEQAKQEYQKAVFYNVNNKTAQEKMAEYR